MACAATHCFGNFWMGQVAASPADTVTEALSEPRRSRAGGLCCGRGSGSQFRHNFKIGRPTRLAVGIDNEWGRLLSMPTTCTDDRDMAWDFQTSMSES